MDKGCLSDPMSYQELGDWRKVDTSVLKRLTNRQLLEQMQLCRMVAGWKLVAELCKRFEKLRKRVNVAAVVVGIVLIGAIVGVDTWPR